MKQSATKRNKSTSDQIQMARYNKKPRFSRPPGMPSDIPLPRQESVRIFLQEYSRGVTVTDAARAAGYPDTTIRSKIQQFHKYVDRYSMYVGYMRERVEVQRAKVLAVDGQMILDEMSRVALSNEFDYLVIEEVEVEVDGKKQKVPRARRKELHEMKREEMVAITVVRGPNGKLEYDLKDKQAALMAVGKNLGLFNEKLIVERRTSMLKATMDLTKVPTNELLKIIQQFEGTVNQAGMGRVIEAQ